ncbi:MAG: 2,4'-dihydroxyacetophenone dioxygenase [Pseudomonadales bacterium]|jgi:2,4'-dihydroxyacetophenone dioxygenase
MSNIPSALLKQSTDLPFINLDSSLPFIDKGSFKLQLLQVNLDAGLWVIRTQFAPGTTVQKHKHTGEIFAFTKSGAWYYKEYPKDINIADSYLYEPAGSTHTLHVPETNDEPTEVCFVMNGANLNLNDQGEVESVLDAGSMLEVYYSMCEAQGKGYPSVMGV